MYTHTKKHMRNTHTQQWADVKDSHPHEENKLPSFRGSGRVWGGTVRIKPRKGCVMSYMLVKS